MRALSFYCFVPREAMEHLPTFLRAAKSRIFFLLFFFLFFKSSTSQVFLFKACSTMPSSSWLLLNAAGLWEWGGGGGEEKGGKKRLEKSYWLAVVASLFFISLWHLFLLHSLCLCITIFIFERSEKKHWWAKKKEKERYNYIMKYVSSRYVTEHMS